MWFIYEKGNRVYKQNRKKVPNPLQRMIYDPEICEKYRCMNKFFEVPAEFMSEERKATQRNGRVLFMVYNNKFKGMFYGFPKYR